MLCELVSARTLKIEVIRVSFQTHIATISINFSATEMLKQAVKLQANEINNTTHSSQELKPHLSLLSSQNDRELLVL